MLEFLSMTLITGVDVSVSTIIRLTAFQFKNSFADTSCILNVRINKTSEAFSKSFSIYTDYIVKKKYQSMNIVLFLEYFCILLQTSTSMTI